MPGSYTATAPPLEALTEREEEVLALIARGKTNGEIANELGITFNTAKTHVARILSKLGVETREEAAAWRRAHPEPVSAPRRRRRWGLFGLPLAAKVAAGAVTAVAVGGLATLGVALMASNGDGDEEPADAATETPASTVTATAEATPGESVTPPVTDADRCPDNGSVLNFEPVFCARWEAHYGDEIAYDITLHYRDPQAGETFTYTSLPAEETWFVFPEAPYERVPLDQCMTRTHVEVQISTTREPPAGDFLIHNAEATLECVEDGEGLYTAVPVDAPSDFPLDFASFTVGESVPFDPGYAYFIATGCWGCDGPTSGVERMYIDAAGELQRDTLFDASTLVPGLEPAQGYIAGYDHSADLSTWLAAVCLGYCGGIAEPDPDSSITLHRSVDGGITWEQIAELEDVHWLYEMQPDGGILLGRFFPDGRANEYYLWRDGELIPAPPPFGTGGAPEAYQLEDGTVLTRTEGGQALVSSDETIRLPLPSAGGFPRTPAVLPGTERRFLTHYDEGHSPSQSLIVYDGNEPVAAYSLDGLNAIVRDWFDETRLMGNIAYYWPDAEVTGNFPAYFDLSTGTIHLIDGPFAGLGEEGADSDDLAGRNYLFAATPGPFARVATGDGDCLNVREAPSDSAGVLVCHVDGVLLRLTGEEAEADGFTWLAVTTPDGRAGWVAAEFVAR